MDIIQQAKDLTENLFFVLLILAATVALCKWWPSVGTVEAVFFGVIICPISAIIAKIGVRIFFGE